MLQQKINDNLYRKNLIKMKQDLESQKSYYIVKEDVIFSGLEVAQLIRQYHVTSKTHQKRITISIKLKA